MTHPGYPPEGPPQQFPPQSPAYPGYPPPAQPTGSWPATSPPPYATSGAPPAAGVPYGQQPAGRSPMLVAVVVAVALFLLAGVMTGLYVAKSSQLGDTRDRLNSQVADRDDTIKANNEKITKTESDLKTASDELTKSKDSLNKVTKERDVLLPCMRRFMEAVDVAGTNNQAALTAALRQAFTACDKARSEVEDS